MSSLFAGLKEKFADKLAEFKNSTAPQDPHEKYAYDIVEAATSDELIAPDWNLNMNVVDFVNSDVHQNSGRILKAIKRSLNKPNMKVQLLSLTLLEACVKNSPVELHRQLASSELWADVIKLSEDTSITRVDAEVRDKVLGMVEDFSRFLQPSQFQVSYERLLDRGVDFPVRAPDESAPFLTPPVSVAAAAGPAATIAAPAEQSNPEGAVAGEGERPVADPLEGLDDQDRAAILAALAELETEAQAAQEAARVAAQYDEEERRWQQQQQQAQERPQGHAQLLQQQQQQQQQAAMEAEAAMGLFAAAQAAQATAVAQAGTAGATASTIATPTGATAVVATHGGVSMGIPVQHLPMLAPHLLEPHQQARMEAAADQLLQPEPPAEAEQEPPAGMAEQQVATLLETANNTTLLLSEMLASVPDSEPLAVREPYVAEVADTCVRLRSRLEQHLATLADEALLASALSQHEELSRVLLRYDELLVAAESMAPIIPRNAAAVAMSHAVASRGAQTAPGFAPFGQQEQQQQHPVEQHPGQAGSGAQAGQKVAAVAAALKERFTGAFDKLMAATASAWTPGAQPVSGLAPMAAGGTITSVASGEGTVSMAMGSGAFTLLSEEDEEADEGTSLMTKRAPQQYGSPGAVAVAAPPPSPPPPLGQHQPQGQLQQLLHEAMAAHVPTLTQPAPPVSAGPDLINFDDEAAPPVPAPAPPASAAPPALSDPTAPEANQQRASATAAEGSFGDLLSGLTIHSQTEVPDVAAPSPLPAQLFTATVTAGPPVTPSPLQQSGVSRDVSGDDHLMNALDLLVSRSSANASPGVETPSGHRTSSGGEPQPPASNTYP